MDFLQAAFFTPTGVGRRIRLVVLHTTQNKLQPGMARSVASYFAGQKDRKKGTSAHYVLDAWAEFQCVKERDVAWAAPGANNDGIQVEHVGLAGWGSLDWASPAAVAMLQRSASIVADICQRNNIPPVFVDSAGLRAGRAGITTHVEVSKAYGGDHWDPGPQFPIKPYVSSVAALVTPPTPDRPGATISGPFIYQDEGTTMKRYDIGNLPLDDGGNGWATLPGVDAQKVVGLVPLGSYPLKEGYWVTPRFGRQMRDGNTIITAVGGTPKTVVSLSVWTTE